MRPRLLMTCPKSYSSTNPPSLLLLLIIFDHLFFIYIYIVCAMVESHVTCCFCLPININISRVNSIFSPRIIELDLILYLTFKTSRASVNYFKLTFMFIWWLKSSIEEYTWRPCMYDLVEIYFVILHVTNAQSVTR